MTAARHQLLVLDSDSFIRELLAKILTGAKYSSNLAATPAEALSILKTKDCHAAIVSISPLYPEETRFVVALRQCYPALPIILLTCSSSLLYRHTLETVLGDQTQIISKLEITRRLPLMLQKIFSR